MEQEGLLLYILILFKINGSVNSVGSIPVPGEYANGGSSGGGSINIFNNNDLKFGSYSVYRWSC